MDFIKVTPIEKEFLALALESYDEYLDNNQGDLEELFGESKYQEFKELAIELMWKVKEN